MSESTASVQEHDPKQTEPLIFSDSAVKKVKELIEEEGNPNLKLRVFVTGGGCSGFQYGFTFDETINPDDTVIEKETDDEGGDDEDHVVHDEDVVASS